MATGEAYGSTILLKNEKEGHQMDADKRQRYEKISMELTRLAGGRENIQGVAHCATRLRIVLTDNDKADLKAMEDVDLAKGVFVAGDQVQIIFGAGLVNDVYEVFAEYNNMKNMSLSDLKTAANMKMNPLQRVIKALSDSFRWRLLTVPASGSGEGRFWALSSAALC